MVIFTVRICLIWTLWHLTNITKNKMQESPPHHRQTDFLLPDDSAAAQEASHHHQATGHNQGVRWDSKCARSEQTQVVALLHHSPDSNP